MTSTANGGVPVQTTSERGVALITTLLVLMLISALLVGFTTVIMTDQRYRVIDKDRGQAFYAAIGGVEKLTADLGNMFLKNVAPTAAQVAALTAAGSVPVIPNVTYTASGGPQAVAGSELSATECNSGDGIARSQLTVGTNGYTVMYCAATANANKPTTLPQYNIVQVGSYAGLMALKTPYQIDITAKTSTGGEVHLVREMEAVSIPVFQFGIFSDVDLAFNAADDFAFGGRVHTNGNLFLAQGSGSTLTLSDKVTAYKEVVRTNLSNGVAITTSGHTGPVSMTKGGGTYRALATSEGSVVAGPTSSQNEPTWHTISLSTYKGYITNVRTGAHQLNLPLIAAGGANIDLIRRPLAGEDPTSIVFGERLFNKASIRVMLSDTAADMTNIPGVDTTVAPLRLEGGNGPYGGIPIAVSPGQIPATTVSSTSGSSPTLAIRVSAVPAFFQVSNYTMTASAAGGLTWSITSCTAKTAVAPIQFSGCSVAVTGATPAGTAIPIGATVQSTVNGVAVSTTTTNATVAVGTLKTIRVSSTANFSPQTFWIDDYPVTCLGYDTTPQFTNCTTSVVPANGHALSTFALSPQDTSLLGGYIKIERLNASDSTWHDITAEILAWGIGGPSQSGAAGACDTAALDPSPNAIIRLQRLHDSGQTNATTNNCTPVAGASKYDYWPNTLYDTRESYMRESAPAGANIKIGGIMHYVAIDAANLAKWFVGTAPYTVASGATGTLSKLDNGGYSIYVSDRRNNRDANSKETGEFGWEDFVNPASATGVPNGVLDAGEDLNANGTLETYGGVPNCNGTYSTLASGGITCVDAALNPPAITTGFRPLSDIVTAAETNYDGTGRGMVNRAFLFRRAVELVHGSSIGTWVTGLTVVAENPVYVKGDWNAPGGGFNEPHAASAVIADAVTVLSSNWLDANSFQSPYAASGRNRTANTYYRMAVLAGKGAIFPQPSGTGTTYGTDGGAHSFLRFLEGNGPSPDTIHYRGSMATFFYNRQAVGIFRGVDGFVYGIPADRDYAFDTDFQIPSKLPPLTPMFRDLNAVGFSQDLRPNR